MIPSRGAAYALFGLAALLGIVAIVSGWRGVSRMAGREDETAAASAAAAHFVVVVGTSDWRDVSSYPEHLRPLTTDALRGVLAEAAIDPAVRDHQRSVATAVESISVTAFSRGEATVVVTATQSRSWRDAKAGPQVERVRQRTSCRLAREDGRWLVAGIQLLSEEPVRADAPR